MSGNLMRVAEVAQMLNVSAKWVYKYSERGELPSVKVGKMIRFQRKEIEDWLASRKKA